MEKRSICRAVVKCIQNFGRKYLKGRRQLENAQKKKKPACWSNNVVLCTEYVWLGILCKGLGLY